MEVEGNPLPEHMKCATHLFYLVGIEDEREAWTDKNYKKVYDDAMQHAINFEKSQNASTCKKQFKVSSTKNFSVVNIGLVVKYLESQEIGDTHFTAVDKQFFQEYIAIMLTITKTIEILFDESYSHLGCLLPILANCMSKLTQIESEGLTHCLPLSVALTKGIYNRFSEYMEDTDCKMAAGFHPRFRLKWVSKFEDDPEWKKDLESQMSNEIEKALEKFREEPSEPQSQKEEFLADITSSDATKSPDTQQQAKTLLKTWLEGPSTNISENCFLGSKPLSYLFIKFNTAIHSSAAFNKFSLKKMMKAKSLDTTTLNYEKMMFINMNKDYVDRK